MEETKIESQKKKKKKQSDFCSQQLRAGHRRKDASKESLHGGSS
jgi:hypothetical protein